MTSPPAIARLLRIRPGEGSRVALMLVYSVAAVGGVVITGQLASRVLFLGHLTDADLPYKFILPPLTLMVVAALYGRIAGRWRRDHVIIGTCLLAAAGFLGLRAVLALPAGYGFAAVCTLYVFADVVGAIVVLQFWTFAGDIFDPREARRLFGLIAGGSTLSNLLFGGTLGLVADRIDPTYLLYVVALSLLACALCATALGRLCAPRLRAAAALPEMDAGSHSGSLSHPLVLTLAGVVLVVTLTSSVADYQLDLALRAIYGADTSGMLSFLAVFRAIAGVGAFALQFFVASRLVDHFGLIAALLLLPVAIAVGGGAILLSAGALWAVAVPRAGDVVLKYTVHDAALNLLFLPLGDRLRARAKALIDGVLKPPVAAAAGVAFLLVGPGTTPAAWVPALFVLVGVWFWLAVRARAQYVDTLSRSLRLRRLDPDRVGLDLTDPASVRILREALSSDDPMRATHAIGWLDGLDSVDWSTDVVALLAHGHAEVRAAAVAFLQRCPAGELDDAIEPMLRDSDAGVRRRAVAALAAHGRLEPLRALVDDPSVGVRGAVVRALLLATAPDAMEQYARLAVADEPAARSAAADLLVHLPDPLPWIDALLADPQEEVVASALRAAAQTCAPPALDQLLPLLSTPRLRSAVVEVASTWARQDAPALIACIDAPDTPADARSALVSSLGVAPAAAVESGLQRWLQGDDAALRSATLALIMSRRDDEHVPPPPAALLQDSLDREMADATGWLVAARDVESLGDVLLDDALRHRFLQSRERCLQLLDLLFDELSYRRLTRSLRDRDRRQFATAVELIDQVIGRGLALSLLPLFDEGEVTGRRTTPSARLTELATSADPWLRACATRALDQSQHREVSPGALRMPLSTLEKVFFLRSVSLFQPLTGEEIAQIVPIASEMEFATGAEIIRRGEEGDCLYILVEGEVEVTIEGGRERIVRSREVIGELAVLAERPRSADCRALCEVIALRIDKVAFWQLLDERPDIAIEVMKVLVERYVPADG